MSSWDGLFSTNEQENQRMAEETMKEYWHQVRSHRLIQFAHMYDLSCLLFSFFLSIPPTTQVRVGLMISAYYCLLLSLRYAKQFPSIPFDFMKFARDSYVLYVEFKKRYLASENLSSNSNNNNNSK